MMSSTCPLACEPLPTLEVLPSAPTLAMAVRVVGIELPVEFVVGCAGNGIRADGLRLCRHEGQQQQRKACDSQHDGQM